MSRLLNVLLLLAVSLTYAHGVNGFVVKDTAYEVADVLQKGADAVKNFIQSAKRFVTSKVEDLKAFLRGLDAHSNLDIPDKLTNITPRDRDQVIISWLVLKLKVKGDEESLLVKFFSKFPEDQKIFSRYLRVPLSESESDDTKQVHAVQVMSQLNEIIENLVHPEKLVEMLTTLGAKHAKIGDSEHGFKELKVVLMKLLKINLGPELTPEALEAWDRTIDSLNALIFKGMRAYEKSHQNKIDMAKAINESITWVENELKD